MEICTTVAHGYNGGDRENIFLALTDEQLKTLFMLMGQSYYVSNESMAIYRKVESLMKELDYV
jgi:hypothetical protein